MQGLVKASTVSQAVLGSLRFIAVLTAVAGGPPAHTFTDNKQNLKEVALSGDRELAFEDFSL